MAPCALFFALDKAGSSIPGKNRDDRNHHQEFDEGKGESPSIRDEAEGLDRDSFLIL
ncbi:MAG: hypothetical protein M2R45_01495 [Verrucomicrobia subdivision 3 bacterium]|nr:hypothetical protein [Limisphaerales bacterium]MCS1413375.1 hypothetical protein [Limisphaerales bacterium]